MIEVGDTVFLNDAGKDLTRYWTKPRNPEKEPEHKRRAWSSRALEVRQVGQSESGKRYYRLHCIREKEAPSGHVQLKTVAVLLCSEDHIEAAG